MNEADLAILKAERLRAEIRYENRVFVLQIIVIFAAGLLAGHFLWR